MARLNFTKRSIEALPTPKLARKIYYDTATRGLGVKVQPSGHKSFFWFRKVQGYPTWRTIGACDELSVEQARTRASEFNTKLGDWKSKNYEGPAPLERQREPTLGEVLEDYIERHLKAHAKNPDRAIGGTRSGFNLYFASWRDRKLGSIRRTDVRELHAKIGEEHRITANRLLQLVKALYNFATKQELWRGENPARGISLFHEPSRARFLQPEELPKLFQALGREKNLDLRDFVLLALFTGARRGDVLALRWEQLDLKRGLWTIPEPKNDVPYTVPLIDEAVEILKERRGRNGDSPWVFPATSRSGHLEDPKRAWKRLLRRAGITGLRIHDLRRTLGSWEAGAGVSLPIIGKSLGHKSSGATQVYARLHVDPVRNAINAATRAMFAAGKTTKQKLLAAPRG